MRGGPRNRCGSGARPSLPGTIPARRTSYRNVRRDRPRTSAHRGDGDRRLPRRFRLLDRQRQMRAAVHVRMIDTHGLAIVDAAAQQHAGQLVADLGLHEAT